MITRMSTKHSKGNFGSKNKTNAIPIGTWLSIENSTEWVIFRMNDDVFHFNLLQYDPTYGICTCPVKHCMSYRESYPIGTVITFTQDNLG